jgi:hypothetical protein
MGLRFLLDSIVMMELMVKNPGIFLLGTTSSSGSHRLVGNCRVGLGTAAATTAAVVAQAVVVR